jgi:hypothetical protein
MSGLFANKLCNSRRHCGGAAVLIFLCLVALPCRADSGASASYIEDVIARAVELNLAERPQWFALLHYTPNRFGSGVTSLVDGEEFFLSPRGKTDPGAELEATLRAFFVAAHGDGARQPEAGSGGPSPDDHPQCRFVARYHWLRQELQFDPVRLRERPCPGFENWKTNLQAAGLTLIFPEAFMNNPASMFGHTLLRVDPAGRGDANTDGSGLLGYAVNFAAFTGGEGGFAFAFKGMTGFYPGYFSVAPYYEKVKEYGDWENRDIWEYRLTFDATETERILMHLWELRNVRFDYYFFDENCSYHLLDLLEIGRPGMRLGELDRAWVIPTDSVRAVADVDGLVGDVRYRPSAATRLRHAARALDVAQIQTAQAIAAGELKPDAAEVSALATEDRAEVLSVAYDVLRYTYLRERGDASETASRSRRILIARSRLETTRDPSANVPEPRVRPDRGHRTARFAFGSGYQKNRFFLEARLRPAFHDLMDPGGGYTRGAQINFLDTRHRLPVTVRASLSHRLVALQHGSAHALSSRGRRRPGTRNGFPCRRRRGDRARAGAGGTRLPVCRGNGRRGSGARRRLRTRSGGNAGGLSRTGRRPVQHPSLRPRRSLRAWFDDDGGHRRRAATADAWRELEHRARRLLRAPLRRGLGKRRRAVERVFLKAGDQSSVTGRQ